MRGRRPVPTCMKLLTGNPGKRPLNANEPQPKPEIPECPPQLALLWQIFWIDRRNWIPESDFQ